MGIYSIWPFFGCMMILLLLASTPVMRAADTPPNPLPNRVSTLDGLRGFLALGVFFHHAAITYVYSRSGAWEPPRSRLYLLLGQAGVAVFFMITGYLFWSKTMKERGRPNWLRLYIGRVFRIGPLYLFAIGSMLAIVFIKTRFHLNEPVSRIGQEIVPWLMLGFILGPGHDVNQFANTYLILAGVTWTLRYEWIFYLSLVITAFAARRTYTDLVFTTTALIMTLCYVAVYLTPEAMAPVPVCFALFLIGMTCASLKGNHWQVKLPNRISSVLVAALVTVVFAVFSNANTAVPLVLLGAAFFLIVSGCTVFGLLTSRAARRLGDVSYGIYLLQGLVLTVVFSFRLIRTFDGGSPAQHWAVVLFCGVLLVIVATVTHVFVERTGIEQGKRVIAMLERKRLRSQDNGNLGSEPVSNSRLLGLVPKDRS